MSFVNHVMAEEADRKDITLFEDSYVSESVEQKTLVHDNGVAQLNYWRNFLLVLVVLLIAILFVNQLPIHSEPENLSYDENVNRTEVTESEVDRSKFIEQQKQNEKVPAVLQTVITQKSAVTKESAKKMVSNKTEPLHSVHSHAVMLLRKGKVEAAITELHHILSLHEYYVEARLLLASILVDQHKEKQAIAMYQQGLSLNRAESRLAQPLASLLAEKGDVRQALKVLEKAAPAKDFNPVYHSLIAALQQQNGQHEDAISVYQRILEVQPDNGKWWLGLGISLIAEARNKEALKAFELSLQDDTVSPALKQFANQRMMALNTKALNNNEH